MLFYRVLIEGFLEQRKKESQVEYLDQKKTGYSSNWQYVRMGGSNGNGVRSEVIEVKEADDDSVSHGKNLAYNWGEIATGRRFYAEK